MDRVMQDKGDKIVSLAREILRADHAPPREEPGATRITLSFKMLCLATVLSAVGGSAVTGYVVETHRPLNRYERTELDALVFYIAHQQNIPEDDVRHDVLAKLQLASFDSMTERDFLTARTYLQNKAN